MLPNAPAVMPADTTSVMPANAGIQPVAALDSRVRGGGG